MAEPFGVHDLADIQRFVQRFTAGDCRADLHAFVGSFQGGCTD